MKAITIRDLHAKTGQWLRQAARHGGIVVTDRGRPLARIVPESRNLESPYFANRKPSPAFLRLARRGKLRGGMDSTQAISEDRDGNVS
jgi:prevent-host-death family protein